MSNLILFWHRRDCISDNTGLLRTAEESEGSRVFCLDPNLLERDDGTGESHIHDWLFAAATAALYTSR